MTFTQALTISLEKVFVRVLTPKWAYKVFWFSHGLRECETAFNELRRYIEDIIAAARTKRLHGKSDGDGEGHEEAADLFRRLIDVNDEEEANSRLSNDELASNVFVSTDLDEHFSVTEADLPLQGFLPCGTWYVADHLSLYSQRAELTRLFRNISAQFDVRVRSSRHPPGDPAESLRRDQSALA